MKRTYYQVILLDIDTGEFRPAQGNRQTAKVFNTYQEAEDDMKNWGLMFRADPNLYLAVQEVHASVMFRTAKTVNAVQRGGQKLPQRSSGNV